MNVQRWTRFALGYLIVVTTQIGVWALAAPASFYDSFPGLGRAWVSVDGPYNEHLIRDVGALNMALGALFVAAWIQLGRQVVMIAGVAALVWGAPHAVYHLVNTEGLAGDDLAISLAGLVLFAVIGGGLVWAARHLESAQA